MAFKRVIIRRVGPLSWLLGLIEMITNSEKVKNHFGYWPDFADALIQRFSFDNAGEILLTLQYNDADQGKAAMVTIQFTDVSDIELSELMAHNTIDEISVTGDRSPFLVTIAACIGLSGNFMCAAGRVTEFKPNYAINGTSV